MVDDIMMPLIGSVYHAGQVNAEYTRLLTMSTLAVAGVPFVPQRRSLREGDALA
jgi:hypothetical protein